MTESDCVFCLILAGELPASFVHEDDRVVAFMDLNPITPGHMLVIPRTHAPALADLKPRDGKRMFSVAAQLASSLRRTSLRTEGINLFLADGEAAGQEVFHAHLHVIPRHENDGVIITGDFTIHQDRDVLEQHAAMIVAEDL